MASTLAEISTQYKHLKKVYDVGCGDGFRASHFNRYNRELYLVDLQDCRLPQYKKFKYTQGDFFKVEHPKGFFDIILTVDLIEHLEQPEKFLKRIHKLLSKMASVCCPPQTATGL